eukprot:2610890-Rhodomonas_salina.1
MPRATPRAAAYSQLGCSRYLQTDFKKKCVKFVPGSLFQFRLYQTSFPYKQFVPPDTRNRFVLEVPGRALTGGARRRIPHLSPPMPCLTPSLARYFAPRPLAAAPHRREATQNSGSFRSGPPSDSETRRRTLC